MGQALGLETLAFASERGRRTPALAVLGIACAGAIASVLTIGFLVDSPVLLDPSPTGVIRGLIVLGYCSAGAYTLWRRSRSRLGLLIAGTGFLFALTSLNGSGSAVVFTLGMTVWAVFTVWLAYVYLCFPRSRPDSALESGFLAAYALVVTVVWTAALVFTDKLPKGAAFSDCSDRCPHNAFQLVDAPSGVATAIGHVWNAGVAIALLGIAAVLLRRTRAADRLRRRAVEPLGYAFAATALLYPVYLLVGYANPGTKPALRVVLAVLQLSIPLAMVFGQIRGRMFAATSAGALAASAVEGPVTPDVVQTMVRDALGDPTLLLALPGAVPGGFAGVDGTPVTLRAPGSGRAVTPVVRRGRTLAAFVHRDDLDIDAAIVEGLAATSLMLLENAELVTGLQASRERIVTAAENERLRLERDLHDGAQQRLMAIQIKLGLLRDRVEDDEVAATLDEIGGDASAAVDELRGLAHGIYPTVLRERGLEAALRSLARTTPIRLDLADGSVGRCDPTAEAAVYFCAVEAIQNATKHAGDGAHVVVMLRRSGDEVEFAVVDDGSGFDPALESGGIGLVSMRDRIEAIGGRLTISSAPGAGGTSVGGVVPVAGR
jgi:signal transduction histidine kinase